MSNVDQYNIDKLYLYPSNASDDGTCPKIHSSLRFDTIKVRIFGHTLVMPNVLDVQCGIH